MHLSRLLIDGAWPIGRHLLTELARCAQESLAEGPEAAVARTCSQHARTTRPRVWPYARPIWLLAMVGTTVMLGSAAVYAAIVVHGRAELVVQPAEIAGVEIDDVHLSGPLFPGGAADVVFGVRNRSKVPVTADRVTALLPLRDARPARCTDKVSGPLLARDGLRLVGPQRTLLAPGQRQEITVTNGLRLAVGAKTGCGFRVTLDVQAVQAVITAPSITLPASPSLVPTNPPRPQPSSPSGGASRTPTAAIPIESETPALPPPLGGIGDEE